LSEAVDWDDVPVFDHGGLGHVRAGDNDSSVAGLSEAGSVANTAGLGEASYSTLFSSRFYSIATVA
jgi:hypothetical protein